MDSSLGGIASLEERLAELPAADRELFGRIFHVSTAMGVLKVPPSMHSWVIENFGSVQAVERQKIVKVTNLVTSEGALFNPLRAQRPMELRTGQDAESAVLASIGDPFRQPLQSTTEDTFGRVRGEHAITASNVAKGDAFHGLVVFDEHDPLAFTAEQVGSYLETAWEWAREAHRWDPEAKYFLLVWNCLWKAGASVVHGHAQMVLGRDLHYAKVEGLRRASLAYQERSGANYFHDLVQAHASLGLAWRWGSTRCLAYLAPVRDNEMLLISDALDAELKRAVHRVLDCLVGQLGVRSFNVVLYAPPLAPTPESWEGFPLVVRIVDRGDLLSRAADVGAMELYASSLISSDPFALAEALQAPRS